MEEISKKIKELELKASKFDDFESNFKPVLNEIFELTEKIQYKLQEINPMFKVKSYSKPRVIGAIDNRLEQLYTELKNSDTLQITIDDISKKFNMAKSSSHKLSVLLRKMDGIQTRHEGKIIYFYYHKPKISKDEVELSDNVKIPTKVSFMRWGE
mgnify:CR=1 FL=1